MTTTKKQTAKQLVLQSLAELPDDATIEDAIEWLYVLHKIERGRADAKAGRTYTQEEAKARMAKWLV